MSVASGSALSDSAELAELLRLPSFFLEPSGFIFNTDFLKSLFGVLRECSLGIGGNCFLSTGFGGVSLLLVFLLSLSDLTEARLLVELVRDKLLGLSALSFLLLGLVNFMSRMLVHGVALILVAPANLDDLVESSILSD